MSFESARRISYVTKKKKEEKSRISQPSIKFGQQAVEAKLKIGDVVGQDHEGCKMRYA